MKRIARWSGIALLALASENAGAASPPAFDRAPIDATLKAFVDDGRAAGVSALIYMDGEEAYFGAFGMRDRESGAPMTRRTIAQIQSMTKPVTGVALMRLYDEGKFALDDPIARYAPELAGLKVWKGFDAQGGLVLAPPRRPPTIRDLTRHTAGFYPRGYESPLTPLVKAVHPIDRVNTLTEFARKLGGLPLLYDPGEGMVYGYDADVEALLIERISRRPYEDYLQERVLDPLGMKDTAYYVPKAKRRRVAAVYLRDEGGGLTRIPDSEAFGTIYGHWPLTPGGHGLTSTIDDFMRLARLIANGGELGGTGLLKEETARLMTADQLPATVTDRRWPSPDGDVGWGINMAVRTAPPRSAEVPFGVVGEAFWEGAMGTLFWIDPENRLVVVFFVQLNSPADTLHKEFRDAVYAAIGVTFAGAKTSP